MQNISWIALIIFFDLTTTATYFIYVLERQEKPKLLAVVHLSTLSNSTDSCSLFESTSVKKSLPIILFKKI